MPGFLAVLLIPYRELWEQVRALALGAVPWSRLLRGGLAVQVIPC